MTNTFSNIINSCALLISFSTASSVFFHDMHLDKMTAASMIAPANTTSYETSNKLINFGGDLHTHSEQTSLTQMVRELRTQEPQIQPRLSEDKKHLLQKHVMKKHHAFDDYSMPIV